MKEAGMAMQMRRHAKTAAFVGAALWVFASVAAALDEIEYQDATRVSPLPEWFFPVATMGGAVLMAMFVQLSDKPRVRSGRIVIFIGAAISLVPLWPFVIIGPFLVTVAFFASAVAAWISGYRTVGSTLHAFGLPLSIPAGSLIIETTGMDEEYRLVFFMVVLALGIVWRAIEPGEQSEPGSPAPEQALA